jgi:hypothetical protein
MTGTAGTLVGALFLAGFIEWFTEWAFGSIKALEGKGIKAIAAVLGIGLACLLQVNILEGILGIDVTDTVKWTSIVVSGAIIGGGSNVIHDMLGKYAPSSANS